MRSCYVKKKNEKSIVGFFKKWGWSLKLKVWGGHYVKWCWKNVSGSLKEGSFNQLRFVHPWPLYPSLKHVSQYNLASSWWLNFIVEEMGKEEQIYQKLVQCVGILMLYDCHRYLVLIYIIIHHVVVTIGI